MQTLGFVVHLLTFNCYGTHLRGNEMGSLDRAREGRGGPIKPSVALVNYSNRIMTHAEATLDLDESFLVLNAIRRLRKDLVHSTHRLTLHFDISALAALENRQGLHHDDGGVADFEREIRQAVLQQPATHGIS